MNSIFCADGVPDFLKIFNLSVAPQLLFYTYFPAIIISMFLGFYVHEKSKTLEGRLFSAITALFVLWVIDILMLWVVAYNNIIMFSWQITPALEIPLFVFLVYFIYIVTDKEKRDVNPKIKLVFLALATLVFALLPTRFNIPFYNINSCEGIPGILWDFIYVFEMVSIAWVLGICVKRYRELQKTDVFRKKIVYFGVSTVFFMVLFVGSNIIGQITTIQVISFWDSLGMVVFLGFLVYLIVRYQEFNIKLLATQALVWGLAILIGAQFFFIKVPINFLLTGVTFIASIIFGYFLIKSVKKEISQREELAKLNIDLQNLLKQRESLTHLITHKVKGSFTHSKYIFAGMIDGTFGEISPELKKWAEKGLESDDVGINTVDLILNASNIQKGLIKYEMKKTDTKGVFLKVFSEKKVPAETKGLQIEKDIKEGDYFVLGDAFWLKEAINNVVENSLKYTKKGKIVVGLEKKNDKILFSVKDTGIGITDEDKKNLFTEGGRGKDSVKTNVDSTGYGLFTVKLVIEAHHGRVWGESEGPDKGSQFYIELPAIEKST